MEAPDNLEEWFELASGRRALLRPIRAGDEPAHERFFEHLSPEDVQMRFFHLIRRISHQQLERLTHIDYDREMAFIATAPDGDGRPETLGVVRLVTDENDPTRAEFAIVVRSDLKRQGLGRALMEKMIDYARRRGFREVFGEVLAENRPMIELGARLGFHEAGTRHGVLEVRLDLTAEFQPEPQNS